MDGVTIRPFRDGDEHEWAAIQNAVTPEDPPITGEDYARLHEERDPRGRSVRFVAEEAGRMVGFAVTGQGASHFDPRQFWLDVTVDPPHLGRGIGKALYTEALADLAPLKPEVLRAFADGDDARTMRFLTDRGFVAELTEHELWCDLAGWAPSADAEQALARVAAEGIRLVSVPELADLPDWERRLYGLMLAVMDDVPTADSEGELNWPFERFVEEQLRGPKAVLEGFFVARAGDELVALTHFEKLFGDDLVDVGYTGVRREWRRRGLALALKLRAMAFAQQAGWATLRTWNEAGNTGMLAINERLGFTRHATWVTLAKWLTERSEADA